ncbi:hypothetical protein C0995_002379, partial [Termitomyces sp. Mi166
RSFALITPSLTSPPSLLGPFTIAWGPVPLEVSAGLDDLGHAIILLRGQHVLKHLVLELIICTLTQEDIAKEVWKDMLSALGMSELGDREEGNPGSLGQL